MRQIKFRAYIKSVKWLLDVLSIDFVHKEVEVDLSGGYGDSSYYGFDEVELMQYTGLKDKTGQEIYEGDILSTDLSRPYLIVEFRNGAFMFQCHDSSEDYYDFMTSTDENSNFTKYHEIIGNVFENTELEGDK